MTYGDTWWNELLFPCQERSKRLQWHKDLLADNQTAGNPPVPFGSSHDKSFEACVYRSLLLTRLLVHMVFLFCAADLRRHKRRVMFCVPNWNGVETAPCRLRLPSSKFGQSWGLKFDSLCFLSYVTPFLTILQCYQMSVVNLNPAMLLLIWKIMAKTMTTVCNDLEISETYEAKCSYKSFWSLLFSSITTDKHMLHPFPFPYIHLILFVCGKTTFYFCIHSSITHDHSRECLLALF